MPTEQPFPAALRPAPPSSATAPTRLGVEALEARDVPSVGGGFTNHGLDGVYYSDPNFANAAFARRDVRLDFDWETAVKPGGSNSPGFRDVGTDNYSAKWTGQLVARFSEAYTFSGFADDVFKLELKPAGATTWTTVVDQPNYTGREFAGTTNLVAGQAYDLQASFKEFGGAAAVSLKWASPSTPREVIDPLDQAGANNPDSSTTFVDIVKGARNSWGWGVGVDADGWPTGQTEYIFQESLNQGLGLDPLMRGKLQFSFRGKADLNLFGNVDYASLSYSYDAATNTTAGSFVTRDSGSNASAIRFLNPTRNGQSGGPGGLTAFKLLRPTTPDATTTYAPGTLFTTQEKDYVRHYTVVRHQYVANQQKEWGDRTLPTYFNQSGGSVSPAVGFGDPSSNGWSWEYKVMFANETGTDLMVSLPVLATGRTGADANSYLVKLANLIKYGSDGVNPYTGPTANPTYPPLNPNLRVYLELGNELWNWGGVFYVDYFHLNQLVAQAGDANNDDFKAISYDLSTAKNSNGEYNELYTMRYRMAVLRTAQAGDIFRSVFGDGAMPGTSPDPRIRPVYEWQYANANDTARLGLSWADRYFNKSDPASPYPGAARPVNYFIWGGGGATYYGANNPNGLTALLPNSGFDSVAVPSGYSAAPANSGWTATGTAGVARDSGAGDDIPAPYDGNQVGYVAGTGRLTAGFTAPADQTSGVYGVSFKAHNRKKTGASAADAENLRVYLDYGTPNQVDITARTFSQGNGYTPPDIGGIEAWKARNVFWTNSDYYYTKSFTLAAGSTHTVTVVGTGAADQLAFLDDVHVTSVDAIYAGGIPGGGEATGQPAGQNVRNSINVAASWAAAFGLKHLAYEGGWSLGGDDGGSAVQLAAKYGDGRTATAQATFMDYYDQAGGEVNVFGTYSQIPSWADYYAQQGLINSGSYPIIQGIDRRADRLGADVTNGTALPAVLGRADITLGDRADLNAASITGTSGWLSWNVVVPRSGYYTLKVSTGAGGSLVLLADEAAVTSGSSGGELSGTVFLARGFHALKVRSTSGAFAVGPLAATAQGAPDTPAVAGLVEYGGTATLSWASVPGAAGYVIQYGTEPGRYTGRLEVGAAAAGRVGGLADDTVYYFAVSSYAPGGAQSLPSAARGVVALRDGQTGRLGEWEFTGLASGGAAVPASAPARATASQARVGALTRGPGLTAADGWVTQYFPDRFASGSTTNTWAQTAADSVARDQFYQFTVAPVLGYRLTLAGLSFQAWFSDASASNGVLVRYSTDGVTFADLASSGVANDPAGYAVDLSRVAALQSTNATVTFRIYTYGLGNYSATAIGLGTNAADLAVRGSLAFKFEVTPPEDSPGGRKRPSGRSLNPGGARPPEPTPGSDPGRRSGPNGAAPLTAAAPETTANSPGAGTLPRLAPRRVAVTAGDSSEVAVDGVVPGPLPRTPTVRRR